MQAKKTKKINMLTQSEYARHKGVSPAAVNKMIKQGKITGAVIKKNKKVYIDCEKADELLEKHMTPEGLKKAEKIEKMAEIVSDSGLEAIDYYTARTLNEQYKAALRKLEYERESAQLLPADEVKKVWSDHIAAVKVRLLAIKSKVAPLIIEYFDDLNTREMVLDLIDGAVREALEDLSKSEL